MSIGKSASEPAGDLWRHTLARIPTLYGRLIYLASLRNSASGEYEHSALTQMVGGEQASETLRRSHGRVFQDWLCLNLEQQKADLEEYLAEAESPATLLSGWAQAESYRELIPATAQDAEQQLFAADLHTLLLLLAQEYSAGGRAS